MADFYIKRNDTKPPITVTLKDSDGLVPVLAGAMVKFNMKSVGDLEGTAKVSALADIEDADNGIVQYKWSVGDTDTTGNYYGEFEVTFNDLSKETFPDSQHIDIQVVEDLG